MGLSFYDPRTGARREFKPAASQIVGVEPAPSGATLREAATWASLNAALSFLGLRPEAGKDIRVGGAAAPDAGAVWLRVAPAAGADALSATDLAARGFSTDDFRSLCLKTHYRRPLVFSWEALAQARAERGDLRASARALADVSLEPSARGRAGYMHRFREAVSKDLDFPEALACLWDGLRPGALSPGSKAALVKEILPVFGIGEFRRS